MCEGYRCRDCQITHACFFLGTVPRKQLATKCADAHLFVGSYHLEILRRRLQAARYFPATLRDVVETVSKGLLWLRPEPTCNRTEGPQDEALNPSTCLLANVVAFCSLLREGAASRFVRLRKVPCVHMSCACRFNRNVVTGDILTCNIADKQQQGEAAASRSHIARISLPATTGADWAAYFKGMSYCDKRTGSTFVVGRYVSTPVSVRGP